MNKQQSVGNSCLKTLGTVGLLLFANVMFTACSGGGDDGEESQMGVLELQGMCLLHTRAALLFYGYLKLNHSVVRYRL